jgi:small subunit ribosomal protein S20
LSKSSSAEKATRAAERKRLRNKSIRSATKTHITHVEKLIQSNDSESAQKEAIVAISAIDRAAKKKVIHPNTAARNKSHLMKKLNKATMVSADKPKTRAKKQPE